jgi:biopolymer transport protein ExbB/TolQ
MQPQGLDFIAIINQGKLATYPLIILSIVSVTVIFERLWALRNMSSVTLKITESLLEPIKKGQRDLAMVICKQNSDCPVGRIFLNILNHDFTARPELANGVATEAMFEETLHAASIDSHTAMTIVEKRMQGRDHPVLAGVPETYYLKCFILRRLE